MQQRLQQRGKPPHQPHHEVRQNKGVVLLHPAQQGAGDRWGGHDPGPGRHLGGDGVSVPALPVKHGGFGVRRQAQRHADPAQAQFHAQDVGQTAQGEFRRRIGGIARDPDDPRRRSDDPDPRAFGQVRQHGADRPERAEIVDLHDALMRISRDLFDLAKVDHPGRGHQPIRWPDLCHGPGDGVFQRDTVRDIDRAAQHPAGGNHPFDRPCRRSQSPRIAREQGHACMALRQLHRRGQTYSAGATRYKGTFPMHDTRTPDTAQQRPGWTIQLT